MIFMSLIGSLVGFAVCFLTIRQLQHVTDSIRMRVCMINSMSLSFIFAILVELTTGSKPLAVILPLVSVCIPLILSIKPVRVLEIAESTMASLMSTSMSVMLIGMVDKQVIWVILSCLLAIEILLYVGITRQI